MQRLQKSYLSFLEKRNSKKRKRGQALLGRPPPFRPSQAARPGLPSSLSRTRTPASLHPVPATWRPYAGVVEVPLADRLTPVGTAPRAPRRHSVPSRSLSSSPLASATAAAVTAAAPLPAEAPPLAAGRASGPFSAPRPPLCSPSPR